MNLGTLNLRIKEKPTVSEEKSAAQETKSLWSLPSADLENC